MKITITNTADLNLKLKWIKPIGGLGDSLILSSVLFDIYQKTGEQVGMYRIQPYTSLFCDHPSIVQFGILTDDFPFVKVDYWSYDEPGPKDKRPYYLLSKMLCGKIYSKEKLWACVSDEDREYIKYFPISPKSIIISTGSQSPRKKWPIENWIKLTKKIKLSTKIPIVQVGLDIDEKIPGVIDIRGKTQPKHVLALLENAILSITVDSFLVHGSAWAQIPSIVLWGPTDPRVFGYDYHLNIVANSECTKTCFGKDRYHIYMAKCDKKRWCMEEITVEEVFKKFIFLAERLKVI